MEEKFNIYVKRLPENASWISDWKSSLCEIPDSQRTILKLELTKEETCKIVKEIEIFGGSAVLIPISYTEPKIQIDEAVKLAKVELEKINKQKGTNSKFSKNVGVGIFWWRFDAEEIQEGGSPSIDIDFVNGKVLEWKDVEIFRNLTKCD
jgi:hypothetical protein